MSYDMDFFRSRQTEFSLNPFGTGQCLTTTNAGKLSVVSDVSIPLEQGNVLRQME